jgi:hypothetical protein
VTVEPQNARVGDEVTDTVAIYNTLGHLVLANARLHLPSERAPIIPDSEQILFLEGYARRDVRWRTKIVASGEGKIGFGAEVISEGRPMNGPSPDISAAVKAALMWTWTGTWESPRGAVYDAELFATFNP